MSRLQQQYTTRHYSHNVYVSVLKDLKEKIF